MTEKAGRARYGATAHSGVPTARVGMRARVTAGFALGALVLSVSLSFLTYQLVRSLELRTEQSTAQTSAFVSANLIRAGLRSSAPDVPGLLESLGTPSDSVSILYYDGKWFSTSLSAGRSSIPTSLVTTVTAQLHTAAATQRFSLDGHAEFAVGIPLVDTKSAYFQLADFSSLSNTLSVLVLSLALAAAATTVAGAAVGRWASGRVLAPLRDTARAAAAIAGGMLDTRLEAGDTDLADLADSFNSMVETLQRRMRRDARFTSDVSHELRSPLTTIENALQVMERRRDDLPERSQQALDLLSVEVRRFEQLVQDLLEISSADGGATQITLEYVDPEELVRHCVATTGASHCDIEVDPNLFGLVLRADKRRMERVIANLIENAMIHAGGVTRVVAEKTDGCLRIVVEDSGPGVPESERQLIFDRFTRGSAARSRSAGKGTGLGLSLVDEHVRMHNGKVWVSDRVGGGARFCVELPLNDLV